MQPGGAMTHAFTVDLEEWFHGIELDPHDWPRESRLREGLDPLIALLDAARIKATFFVLGAVARSHPNVVATVAEAGHEIASHGDQHEFVYRQTPEQFRADIRRATDSIGEACGSRPRGYRAPYFSITKQSLWALDILKEEGFDYDSSIFPVQNDRYGIPGAWDEPHVIETSAGPLREIPLTPLRIGRFALPFSGGAYLRILPWWVQWGAWQAADRKTMPTVAYIHPWELDPGHPRIHLRRRVALTHYARLGLTERRLRRLFRHHQFGRLDVVFT